MLGSSCERLPCSAALFYDIFSIAGMFLHDFLNSPVSANQSPCNRIAVILKLADLEIGDVMKESTSRTSVGGNRTRPRDRAGRGMCR